MIKFLKKPFVYAGIFSVLLVSLDSYVLLKTFVPPSAIISVKEESKDNSNQDSNSHIGKDNTEPNNTATITDSSYEDSNIKISIDTIRKYDTTIYIADVSISSAEYLKTALAQDTFGTNITEKTSSIASEKMQFLPSMEIIMGQIAKDML